MYKLNIVHVFYSLSLHSYFCYKCSIPKIEHEVTENESIRKPLNTVQYCRHLYLYLQGVKI